MTNDEGPFRPPKLEWVAELVGDRTYYAEGIRWRLFADPDDLASGKHILVVLGDSWTILDGTDFLKLARRILSQMDQDVA